MHALSVRRMIGRNVVMLLVCAVALMPMGCAAIFSSQTQTMIVRTVPEGRTVYFQGLAIEDGQPLTVRKKFKTAQVNIGTPDRPHFVDLDYSPDLWLIGDGVLLLFFVIPGLVALGVDFGTGAWRDFDDQQLLYVGVAQ